jgi:4-hydroxy-2-oxoheptanedioate aldolase
MRANSVKEKWRQGKPAIGGWLGIPSSYTAEVMAAQGFDWVCVDTQHGAIDFNSALPMLQAISTSDTTMPFVRVPWSEPSIIMKYLDAGAYGVIVPMISTRQQAEDVVAACRYPPAGIRSSGPYRGNLYGGPDYLEHADEEIACVIMIETPQALDNLDDILSVPGIDAAYIGPSDLSQALGLGPRYNADNPKHAEAVNKIREACERHGVVPGVHTNGSALTSRYIKEGFKMILLTADAMGVAANARSELAIAHKTRDEVEGPPIAVST